MKDNKIRVYTKERGIRCLKEGFSLEQYQIKFPGAIRVKKPPTMKTLVKWSNDGIARALDGCRVEPDGECAHGLPSWMIALGII
jgi:hypothetical protein